MELGSWFGEMFALKTQGPEFETQKSDIKGWVWWPALVIPAPGEVETGTSLGLSGQPSLLGKFQISERWSLIKKKKKR